jgi:8-hydroxy-5-deazaflavin:NADPH oxidoreductase
MRIGILGSGLMGGKLGSIFARAGHDVVFSYARSASKLKRLARAAGKRARAGTPAEAARGADVVLLAVHWSRLDDVLSQAGRLSGRTLVNCSMPMSADDSRLVVGFSTSGAEQLARKARGARVVSAFSTVPSEVLLPVFERRARKVRPDLMYCGDDPGAKRMTATLMRAAGFNPLDMGALRTARLIEPFVLLIAQLAYRGGNPALAYRFERLRGPAT